MAFAARMAAARSSFPSSLRGTMKMDRGLAAITVNLKEKLK
jgi:hypothetical protein